MPDYLFVYGTLMKSERNQFSLLLQKHTEFIDKGYIFAKKYDLGAYPGIKLDMTKTAITKGELYQIANNFKSLMEKLDNYEGYIKNNEEQSLFIRKKTEVITPSKKYNAWIYEYALPIS